MVASLNLGIGLVIAGLIFVILVWGLLGLLPRAQANGEIDRTSFVPAESDQANDAVLVIQSGGRVDYVNQRAREWFGLREHDSLDLERMIRRVRPSEEFLDVCAAPGQKRLSVNGKLVEVTSYQVPGVYPQMLVSLRGMDLAPALSADGGEFSSSILRVVTDFSQSITSSLELEAVLHSILDNVSRLVPADLLEIKVWDEAAQSFVPYHFVEADGAGRTLVRSMRSQFGVLGDRMIETHAPLLLVDARAAIEEDATGAFASLQSYLGLPLMAGDVLVGLLEAGQTTSDAFGDHDLELLQLVSGQIGLALQNAIRYEAEQVRVVELTGLANLAQAVSAIQEPQELFARLVESILPLFEADIVGFLLYDEKKDTLEGQVPFHGLPAQIVEVYRSTILPESPAEALLKRREPFVTLDAAQDENWRTLGLADIAIAASLRDSVLEPLVSSGELIGYLQISHHRGETSGFSASELKLMEIVAEQAASIIQNANLVQESRQRSQRSDALRRIASLANSNATLDEVLKYGIQEVASLFQADLGILFLLNEARGELALHTGSAVGIRAGSEDLFPNLVIDAPEYLLTVSGSQLPAISGRLSVDRNVASYYRPLVDKLGMESMVAAPLIVRDKALGELLLSSHKTDHFSSDDLQVVSTIARQIATAMDSQELLTQSDQTLVHRVEHLISIARVSRELAASLELNHLLDVIHKETVRTTGAECGAVLILNPESKSDDPRVSQAVGCPFSGELSRLERSAIQDVRTLIVDDFEQGNFLPPHEGVRSALIVPITLRGNVVGLIQLHAGVQAAFGEGAKDITETLASQAAIALGNARQYQVQRQQSELMRRRAETLEKFSNTNYALNPDQPVEESLKLIAEGIRESTPFQVVLISLYEADAGLLRRVVGAGIAPDAFNELMTHEQPLTGIRQLFKPEFRISRSYFIPADKTPVLPAEIHYTYSQEYSEAEARQNAWDPDDFLLIPLEDARGNVLGLISLDDPKDGYRPDQATIDSLELFAAQAVQIIDNARQFSELRSRAESLSSGLQRQQKLLAVTQNDLPVLLRKDLEQTIALHNLDYRAQRVRAGLVITESVSRQLDASSALLALGRETLTQLNMSIALVAENTPEGPRLLHALGAVPRSSNPEALFGQRNPLRSVLQNGEPILIANLDENNEWRDTPLLSQMRVKGLICLPVKVEDRPVAAMLALSMEPMPAFTEEDRQVYYQISRQTSVVLQNISLLNETRRRLQEVNLLLEFSRRLSGLDPSQIINALLDSGRRVIQVAHAGAVFLWNEQSQSLQPRAVSGYADNDALMRITYRRGEALPGSVFAARKPRRVDEIDFPRDYILPTENLGRYRQGTGGRLPVSSLLVPILTGEQEIGLIVLDNFNTTAAFRPEDEALIVSLCQQVALSLENVRLVHAMTERAGQLEALNDVATAMTSSLRHDELAASLLDQAASVLSFDTATLWLRDEDKLKVAAARGFPDTDKRLGLALAVADSALFKEMVKSGQPISVGDVREDARFPSLEAPRLSWLGVPLIAKGELIGLFALEKWQAYFYSREQVQLATTFASQAAIALDNAALYEDSVRRAVELDERSQRLALLNRFSSSLSGLLDSDQILDLTADELRSALDVHRTSVVVFEREKAQWIAVSPSIQGNLPRQLPDAPLFSRLRESLGVFNTEDVKTEPDLATLRDFLGDEVGPLLVLPLVSGGDLRGLLFASRTEPRPFSLTEIELSRTIANQTSIALENARLYQSTVRTAERFAILNQASAAIGASLDPEAIYASIHQAAQSLMPIDVFIIGILDEEKREIEGVYSVDQEEGRTPDVHIPLGQGLSNQVILNGNTLLINGQEKAEAMGVFAVGKRGTPTSVMAVPMVLGERVFGMLSAQSYRPNDYTEEDLQILSTLANQAVVSIQNGRLFGETQRLAQELEQRVIERTAQLQQEQQNTETLLRILTEVSSSLDLDRALNRTLSLMNDAVGADQGTIMLLNAEDNLLHYRAGYGYLSEQAGSQTRRLTLKVGQGLAGWVVENRDAALVNDLYKDERWMQSSSGSREHRSAVAAPLLVGEDVIGVMMVFSRTENYFTPEVLSLVKAIASQVAVAINNAHLYELIRDQAERLGSMLRKEQEEASRSQAILEAVADGVLVTGPENRITFLNSSFQRILDVDSEKLLGRSLQEQGGLFGKAAATWMETIQRWSQAPGEYETGDTYAEQLELGDGRIALVHLAPVILESDFLGTVSIFRDITHEVEVDRLKSEFVATVSHELRTPMTSIKGYVDILLMGAAGAINENQSHFLDIVKNNIERLNVLVDDLLDVSRIEAGRVILSSQPLDLHAVAKDVVADVKRRAKEENKPMEFSLSISRRLPQVLGDPERVRQILSNLVDNAYHYTPENGTVKVRLRSLNGRGEVQVDVTDNGVGVAKADQERVFERFYRGEHPFVLATPGTGLGLAIVKQLVEMHEGRIWMKSKGVSGEGSTFSFTLPVYKDEGDA